MDKGDLAIIIAFICFGILISFIVYVSYQIYLRETAPNDIYCKETTSIIYVNKTALTNADRCLDYLLSLDYKLLGKNGSYYILEPKLI